MMIIPSVYRSETRIYHMHGRQVTYLCMVVRFGAERLRKVAMPPVGLYKHRCLNFRRVAGFHHESHFFADSAERRRRMRRAIQSSFWMHSLEPEVPKGEPIQPALTILDRRTSSHECKGAIMSPTTAREQSIRKSGR